jgi:hypothetical protein
MQFKEILVRNNLCIYLSGWVSGETFRDVLFIEYGFYNPEAEKLFKEFMLQNANKININMLDNEIIRIEAETLSVVSISSKKELIKILHNIDSFKWVDETVDKKPLYIEVPAKQANPDLFISKRSKKSFRYITVLIYIKNVTLLEKSIFLRMLPIIYDAININLYKLGLYQNDISSAQFNHNNNTIFAISIYSIKRATHTLNEIKSSAKEAINSINIIDRQKELSYYLNGYLNTPDWHTFPIEYYRDTGILVSKKQVFNLMTPRNVQNIVNKIEIEIKSTDDAHWDICS